MLDWKSQNDDEGASSSIMRCGSYRDRWLSPGTYFLEIIVTFCKDFGVNSLLKSREQNESEWLSFDFQHQCMEDPNHNRITGKDSYIIVIEREEENSTGDSRSLLTPRGRWIPTTPSEPIPIPLFHRYQPQGCKDNPDQEVCEKPTNGTALWSYSFEWKNNFRERWRERIKVARDSSNFSKVCFVGWSHSRHLNAAFRSLTKHATHVKVKFSTHVKVKFPEDITPAILNNSYHELGCKAFVIAAAQWPGSSQSKFPYLFEKFYAGMKGIVEAAYELFASEAKDVRVYMRSIHEVPIGDWTGSCPAVDWRSPDVIHGYTHLVKKAVDDIRKHHEAAKRMIHFLDTSFIVSPMWDSAPDWYHLPEHVTEQEALYIASVVSSNA